MLRGYQHWIYKTYSPKKIVIVPSIRIKVKNLGESPLHYVSFKGHFELESTGKPFSQGTKIALEEPLSPQKISEEIYIKAEYGYSVSSMDALERNKATIEKIKVRVFAKTKDSEDVLLGIFPIKGMIKAAEK